MTKLPPLRALIKYGLAALFGASVATACVFTFPFAANASVDFASISLDPLSQGLVGYWPFDGDTTSWTTDTTADISGQNNTGTLINMSTSTAPTIGKIGQAIIFKSASSQYINVPTTTVLNPTSPPNFTLSAWVKKSTANGTGPIANKNGDLAFGIGITPCTTNQVKLTKYTVADICIGTFPADTNYHYLTAVWSSTGVSLYIDGVLNATSSNTSNFAGSAQPFTIGYDNADNVYFNGTIDDVRAYNRALSPQEVQLLYSLGTVKPGNTPQTNASSFNFGLSAGLAAYWPLDGNTTNWKTDTTADVSGGNTGTMVGMSTTTSPTIGKIGQALKFNGSSNYIATTYTVPAQNSSTSFTWSAWLKLPAGNPSNVVILGNRGGGGATWIKLTPTAFEYNGGIISHTIPTGVWVQVTMVKSGTNFTYYQNDTVIGTATNSGSASAYTFYMGEDPGYTGDGDLTGTLDDVRVYSRALSYQEVQDLYKEGSVAIGNSPTPTSATSGTGLNAGLVAYWTFDGPETNWATSITQDSSGNGENGTMIGMSTTTSPTIGKIGQALKFNGTTQYIETGTVSDGAFVSSTGQPHSGFAWVKPTSPNNGNIQFIWEYGEALDRYYSTGLVIWSGDLCWPEDTGGGAYYCSSLSVPANQWSFVGVVRNNSSTVTFYLNGTSATVSASAANFINSNPILIGAGTGNANPPGGFFPGTIDDVRLYNRALSYQEVQQLYLTGR